MKINISTDRPSRGRKESTLVQFFVLEWELKMQPSGLPGQGYETFPQEMGLVAELKTQEDDF